MSYERGVVRSVPVVGAGLGLVVIGDCVAGSDVVADVLDVVVVVVGACAGRSSPPQAVIPSVHINAMHDFFISSSSGCGALRNTRARARGASASRGNGGGRL
jgi:hypothetical protein